MAIKSTTSLKSFFEQGDRPSEVQFIDLIDSTYSGEIGAAIVSAAAAGSTGVLQVDSASAVSFLTTGTAGVALLSANTPASARTVLSAASAGDAIFQIGTIASVRTFISAASDASASTTQAGLIEIATTAEATAGTDATRAITPATQAAALAERLSLGAEVATTSGTAVTLASGIPANAKRIVIMIEGLSASGTSVFLIQLGDAGGFEATGYQSHIINATNNQVSTAGFRLISTTAAARTFTWVIELTLKDATNNTWAASINGARTDSPEEALGSGMKSLSAALTQIQITTAGGADTFDAGSAAVMIQI